CVAKSGGRGDAPGRRLGGGRAIRPFLILHLPAPATAAYTEGIRGAPSPDRGRSLRGLTGRPSLTLVLPTSPFAAAADAFSLRSNGYLTTVAARVHPAGAVVRREGSDVVLRPTRRRHREKAKGRTEP